jgi:hypothetical protein
MKLTTCAFIVTALVSALAPAATVPSKAGTEYDRSAAQAQQEHWRNFAAYVQLQKFAEAIAYYEANLASRLQFSPYEHLWLAEVVLAYERTQNREKALATVGELREGVAAWAKRQRDLAKGKSGPPAIDWMLVRRLNAALAKMTDSHVKNAVQTFLDEFPSESELAAKARAARKS